MAIAQTAYSNDGRESLAVSLPLMSPSYRQISRQINDDRSNQLTSRYINRQVPILVRVNRVLRTFLIASCGLALLGYGLDVSATSDVSKLQGQACRLTEQNTELSAQLLRVISFQGIQSNVVNSVSLQVPEKVIIVKEIKPVPVQLPYKPRKHFLPIMSGY